MFLELTGTLHLGPGKQCSGEDGPLTGPLYPLTLTAKNGAPKAQAGLFEQTIDSELAFEVLPFPANLRATITYLAPVDEDTFDVRYTFADDATVVVTQKGMSLIEHDPENPVKGIAVQGAGVLRWLAAGVLA